MHSVHQLAVALTSTTLPSARPFSMSASSKSGGVPAVPESVFRYDGSREGWKYSAGDQDQWETPLQLVVAGISSP